MEQQGPIQQWRNDVFISYSDAADGTLAPALQTALEAFARSCLQRRLLRVFRDPTGPLVTPDSWEAMSAELAASAHFVLLASPRVARSNWVRLELQAWLAEPCAERRLLIVLTDGDIAWDGRRGDFDWARTTALPETLRGVFDVEPRYADLRALRRPRDVKSQAPVLDAAVASIFCTITGRCPDDVRRDQLRRNRLRRRLAVLVLLALLILIGVAVHLQPSALPRTARAARTMRSSREASALASDHRLLDGVAARVELTRSDTESPLSARLRAECVDPPKASSRRLLREPINEFRAS